MRWAARFVSDELWLRSRRVLLDGLRGAGLDSSYDVYREYLEQQHAVGMALLDRLAHRIGRARCAEMAAETFLDTGHRRFSLRLPFILAFAAEYAGWLVRLAPVPPSRTAAVRDVRELAALFNLGIVLVDQLADEPARRGSIGEIFGGGRLERLLVAPTAAAELRRLAPTLATPELRVLGAVVAAFFDGVETLASESAAPELRSGLKRALGRSYAGQLAVVRGARDEAMLRAKSVLPFMIPPLLVRLAGAPDDDGRLLQLGERTGEVFWRVDDLVDVGRDFAADDGNVVLSRTHVGDGAGRGQRDGAADTLACVLDSGVMETLATEAVDHARAGMALVGEHSPVRGEAARWLEMYILDWMR